MAMALQRKIAGWLGRSPAPAGDEWILPLAEQVAAWRRAARRMRWKIAEGEFAAIGAPPPVSAAERSAGWVGTILCYGFGGTTGQGSDAVLSGQLAWEYAVRRRRGKTWRCEYVDFARREDIRLRPGAPPRPRGFYFAKLRPAEHMMALTVSQARQRFSPPETGCGPEGFQLLAITHPHAAERMSQRRLAFMALADYDVAPHGFNDFYDAVQLFCSNGILGLGIGNVDHNYPLFGVPTVILCGPTR